MANKSLVGLATIPGLVLVVLFLICFGFNENAFVKEIASVQASFLLTHQVAGAFISAIGIGLFLTHYGGKLPAVPLGRSLLILLIGLAIFSMSPIFGVAGVAVYIADSIWTLKVEKDVPES